MLSFLVIQPRTLEISATGFMLTVCIDSLESDEGATTAESAEKEVTPSLDYLFEDGSGNLR